MKQAVQFALRIYNRCISPALPHSCRFVPTCSEYAMEAVQRHGVMRGSILAVGRLLRCHPFARAGYDPVPVVEQAFRPSSAACIGRGSGSEVSHSESTISVL